MLEAREVKSIDEITLLNMAAAMVDGVDQDIAEALKPGVRESYRGHGHCTPVRDGLRPRRGHQPISAERRPPYPHNFTDRLIRPGDEGFSDVIQSFMGDRTVTTVPSASAAPRAAANRIPQGARMDGSRHRADQARHGQRQDRRRVPRAEEIGFASEMDASV